jgi:hypothetical protein
MPKSSFKSDLVTISMSLHHRTERAILVSDDGERDKAVWIPKSQCEFEETSPGIVEVTMSERTALDKGLI